jgi:type I restriction enzyme M protein
VRNSKGKIKKGEFTCELIPKELVIDRYFANEKAEIDELKRTQETAAQTMEELEEEHPVDDGLLDEARSDAGNVTKGELTRRMKEIKGDSDYAEEYELMKKYKSAYDNERKAKKAVKEAEK